MLTKVDATRHIRGCFYAIDNWKEKWEELRQALEQEFENAFKNNGNSFDSCFQFVGQVPHRKLMIKIKFYNKILAMIQSDGVMRPVGMNTNGLFCPYMHMSRALSESRDEGLSRIKITYTATTLEAEQELFTMWFPEQAKRDLDSALSALNSVDGLGRHLPMRELFEGFIAGAKGHQLLIVQPTIAAMIYASNSKPGCYTGFWQTKAKASRFQYLNFLAAYQLPGPASRITCIFQEQGTAKNTRFLTLEKQNPLSQIPGFTSFNYAVANLPRPLQWDDKKLSAHVLGSMHISILGTATYEVNIPKGQV